MPPPLLDRPETGEPSLPTVARRKPLLFWLRKAAALSALSYLLFLAMLFPFQRSFIFPGRISQGKAFAVVQPPPDAELVRLPTPYGEVAALYGSALSPEGKPLPPSPRRLAVLFFYGNGECIKFDLDRFERLRRMGANVLIPDYLGYGMSGGKASEAGCIATADAAYRFLTGEKKADPKRLVIAGWSLGGAVAIDLASRELSAGLAAFSTFTSLADMARHMLPFLPAGLLLLDRFDSESKIARVSCPILLGHGEQDRRVPFAMRDRLAAAATGTTEPVERFAVPGAGHNDFFDGDLAYRKLAEFLRRLERGE